MLRRAGAEALRLKVYPTVQAAVEAAAGRIKALVAGHRRREVALDVDVGVVGDVEDDFVDLAAGERETRLVLAC